MLSFSVEWVEIEEGDHTHTQIQILLYLAGRYQFKVVNPCAQR